MCRDTGRLTDAEMSYDSSSGIEPKRGHQWFMDATAPELFSNKKQAIDAVNSRTISIPHINSSPWPYISSFQSVSGQFPERLFGSKPVQSVNVVDRSIPSADGRSFNFGRKDFQGHYNNSSMGLSLSPFVEDPSGFNVGAIRKVRVNQVRDSGNGILAPTGHYYSRGDGRPISVGTTYHKSDNGTISLGPNNNNSDENTISMGHIFSKVITSFSSMDHSLNKGDENFISMGSNYSKRNDHENFISMRHIYNNANENFISMNSSHRKVTDNIMAIATAYDKLGSKITSVDSAQDKEDAGVLSTGYNYDKGETNALCFGVFQDETEINPSRYITTGYDFFMGTQSSALASEKPGQKDLVEPNVDSVGNNSSSYNNIAGKIAKAKEPKNAKKVPASRFLSNVKSLLSTGMLDGVPVKYVSWSREKNLKGTIKGTAYLCGCKECNFNKALNAYEFERHANCKTKHPNNHIYLENGKTIYSAVQELKNIAQEKLYEEIQTVTGAKINLKNFLKWKASFQAASRELKRIYGKDDIVTYC